jgi:hypothetical protein
MDGMGKLKCDEHCISFHGTVHCKSCFSGMNESCGK